VRRIREERRDAAARTGASRKIDAIWGKTVKFRGVLYRTVTVLISNRDKRPFRLRSFYKQRLKVTLFVTVCNTNRDKRGIRAGCPEGEFSPFCHGWKGVL
jgi:hypothetical protein